MFQTYDPSANLVFSHDSCRTGFLFTDQEDVFQSFVPNVFDNQPTNGQYAFQDGTAGINLQVNQLMLEQLILVIHLVSLLNNQIIGNPNIALVYIFLFFSKEATTRRIYGAISTWTTKSRATRTQFEHIAFMVGK